MKLIHVSQTEKGLLPGHLDKLQEVLKSMGPGNYVVKIESNDIVGNPQGRYWAILKIISIDVGCTDKDLHDEYKKLFNKGKSTKVFRSDKDWWDYINQVTMHARTFHGCHIPEGRDMHYKKLMEIEESYKRSFNN